MRHQHLSLLAAASLLAVPLQASAEEIRVHAAGAAAHAVGPHQQREFGGGGGGSATVELPLAGVLGVQAGIGGVVLAQGKAPTDPGIAPQAAGTALLGTAGARLRPFGARRPAGPWIDANGGVARTGDVARPMFDTHLGWDFRVSQEGRWDVGPFVGYTQILERDAALRSGDARIVWAGIQVSLGAPSPKRPAPPAVEPAPRYAPPPVQEAKAPEPDLEPAAADMIDPGVQLVADRIVLDDVVHFEFDSPRVKAQSYPLVRRVAEFLLRNDDLLAISIEGHADAIGSEEYNQRLSEARAKSMRTLLVRFGVEESRLETVGHGKSRLKVSSALPLRENRRVELVVTRVKEVPAARTSMKTQEGVR
jgi:outer membrane protein OmpA-like peptidoglycan-associated protein